MIFTIYDILTISNKKKKANRKLRNPGIFCRIVQYLVFVMINRQTSGCFASKNRIRSKVFSLQNQVVINEIMAAAVRKL